ncbi:MAG: hypothetical protein AVDCRST_MAG49-2514, partial [uncultured Thermomicrobiales bacterium]
GTKPAPASPPTPSAVRATGLARRPPPGPPARWARRSDGDRRPRRRGQLPVQRGARRGGTSGTAPLPCERSAHPSGAPPPGLRPRRPIDPDRSGSRPARWARPWPVRRRGAAGPWERLRRYPDRGSTLGTEGNHRVASGRRRGRGLEPSRRPRPDAYAVLACSRSAARRPPRAAAGVPDL